MRQRLGSDFGLPLTLDPLHIFALDLFDALLLGGGLSALQGAAVSTGIPFTLVVLTMCYCLWLALRAERAKM